MAPGWDDRTWTAGPEAKSALCSDVVALDQGGLITLDEARSDGAQGRLFFGWRTAEEVVGLEQERSIQEKETGTIQGTIEPRELSVVAGRRGTVEARAVFESGGSSGQ